jgi:hypothetical protein
VVASPLLGDERVEASTLFDVPGRNTGVPRSLGVLLEEGERMRALEAFSEHCAWSAPTARQPQDAAPSMLEG